MKPVAQWGQPIAQDADQQVSSFAVDPKALHFAVNDTVVERRGQFPDYRPGDIWRMLQGMIFSK